MSKFLEEFQPAAAARLFSASVIKSLAEAGVSPLFSRLVKEAGVAKSLLPHEPIKNVFEMAYRLLQEKSNRHEYVYKSAIAHKILLGKHSLRTATMLTEFRVGTSKADVVILNGTSTVYEIKSERDNLDRLESQLNDYKKVFARINIITGHSHLQHVLESTAQDVGILLLNDRFQISTIRESQNNVTQLCPIAIFESMNSKEALRILAKFKRPIPAVPNTLLHKALKEEFAQMDPQSLHDEMVSILKTSRKSDAAINHLCLLPKSLQAAAIAARLNPKNHIRLIESLDTPLRVALHWS